jgi:peptide/nickel transport system ATP-binding protein
MTSALLQIEDLTVRFDGADGPVLDRVSLEIPAGTWTGLVGESGSGKSLTSLSIMGLLPAGARVLGGRVLLNGRDLLGLSTEEFRQVRGTQIGMIFQSPRSALNPLMTVGAQIARAVSRRDSRLDARREARELLRKVRIPDPDLRASAYPHQLSGGMCQRVLIAMMLALKPRLLIADEPTTGLDVTVQAEILDLMQALQRETGMAVLLISHDLGIVAEQCARVAVMFGGHTVEAAPARVLFRDPRHPYTAMLMATLLRADRPIDIAAASRPRQSAGLSNTGCIYAARCPFAEQACREQEIALLPLDQAHAVACRRQHELAGLTVEEKAGMAEAGR